MIMVWNAKDGRSAQAASGRKAWVGAMGGDTHRQISIGTEGSDVWS